MSVGEIDKEWGKNVGSFLDETGCSISPIYIIPCWWLFNWATISRIPSFNNVPCSTALLAACSLCSLVLLALINPSPWTSLADTADSDACSTLNWLLDTRKPKTELEGNSELWRRIGELGLLCVAFPSVGFILEGLKCKQSRNMQDVDASHKFRKTLPDCGKHRTPPSLASTRLAQHSSECGVLLGLFTRRVGPLCPSSSPRPSPSTDFLQSGTRASCTLPHFSPRRRLKPTSLHSLPSLP